MFCLLVFCFRRHTMIRIALLRARAKNPNMPWRTRFDFCFDGRFTFPHVLFFLFVSLKQEPMSPVSLNTPNLDTSVVDDSIIDGSEVDEFIRGDVESSQIEGPEEEYVEE